VLRVVGFLFTRFRGRITVLDAELSFFDDAPFIANLWRELARKRYSRT
jgi:hypothetical protein